MTIEERLLEAVRTLPLERRAEVLDFAEFLKQKTPLRQARRPFGLCAGEFEVPDDFDAPLPDSEIEAFEQ